MHESRSTAQYPLAPHAIFFAATLCLVAALPLGAQMTRPSKPPAAAAAASQPGTQPMLGTWSGTASVQLGDSAITVPVTYTFTQSTGGIGGTAMVPGQGNGTISNMTRTGSRVQFRVTVAPATVQSATQGTKAPAEPTVLEHDGTLGADGALQGTVNHNGQPVAKFKIAQKKP